MPSCPFEFKPHVMTLKSARTATMCAAPAARCVTRKAIFDSRGILVNAHVRCGCAPHVTAVAPPHPQDQTLPSSSLSQEENSQPATSDPDLFLPLCLCASKNFALSRRLRNVPCHRIATFVFIFSSSASCARRRSSRARCTSVANAASRIWVTSCRAAS